MDLYDEFFSIIRAFEDAEITYAVIGGIALAFHDKPRFTRDIDILVNKNHFEEVEKILRKLEYFSSTDPHKFLNVDLVLHRFVKTEKGDHLLVDLLIGENKKFDRVFENSVKTEWEEGVVSIASKKDLIWLKKFRNSDQDKTDIKKLSNDQD